MFEKGMTRRNFLTGAALAGVAAAGAGLAGCGASAETNVGTAGETTKGGDAWETAPEPITDIASVLGSAAKRSEYDKACAAGVRPTWGDLGQLGAVGQWNPRPQQAQQQAQS